MQLTMDILCCFIAFLVCIFSTLVLKYTSTKLTNKTNLCLPPSPPSLPLIGHLHHLSSDLSKSFCTLSSKYGPLLHLRLGFYHLFLVSSTSLTTEMLTTHDLAFSGKPKSVFEDSGLFAERGIIMSPYGDHWKFMKKLCVTQLLGANQIQRSKSVRREELEQFLRLLVDKAYKNELVDITSEILKTTNNSICRMVMSTRCSGEDNEAEMCRELVKEVFELAGKLMVADMFGPLGKLGYWVYGKRLADVSRRCDELLEKIMKEHEEKQQKDLMDVLLQVYKDQTSEFKITRSVIKAFIMDLFIAGTTTSAEAITWVMAELISRPKIFNKVREEIESVAGSRMVEESDISELPYLQAVVKETLRLHPPGPIIPRQSRADCRLGKFDIPKNSIVFVNTRGVMTDPEIWEDPNEFRPERFMVEHNNLGYISFGGGRRSCPGKGLALATTTTAVALMVQCFDWKFDDHQLVDFQHGATSVHHGAPPLSCLPVIHFNPFAA